jgi:hypothetical protein
MKRKPGIRKLHGWFILRDANPKLPKPAAGRLVVAVAAPRLSRRARKYKELALIWQARDRAWVIHGVSGDGLLLASGMDRATWLPEAWKLCCYPAGWTPAHVDRWFRYALYMIDDVPAVFPDGGPQDDPSPRNLVAHAHLIARHLGLAGCGPEPRAGLDRGGCRAELLHLQECFRRNRRQPEEAERKGAPPEPPAVGLSEARASILETLRRCGTKALTGARIADALASHCRDPKWRKAGFINVSPRTVRTHLPHLEADGLVEHPTGTKVGYVLTERGHGALAGRN